ADGVERGAKPGPAERVAAAKPGEPVDLAEGAHDHQVREVAKQVDRGVGIVVELELDVGLVEGHGDVVRHPRAEVGQAGSGQTGGGGVVRVADADELGRG